MTGSIAVRTGILEERVVAEGTRAERLAPVVVTDEGDVVPVYLVGDLPHENETLRPLLGQRVEVSGTFRNRTLRVTTAGLRILSASVVPSSTLSEVVSPMQQLPRTTTLKPSGPDASAEETPAAPAGHDSEDDDGTMP